MTPKRQTRLNAIRNYLKIKGSISRNDCIFNLHFSTRLGAYIEILRNDEGWNIEGKKKGGDFVYTVLDKPHVPEVKIVEKLVDGKLTRVATYV